MLAERQEACQQNDVADALRRLVEAEKLFPDKNGPLSPRQDPKSIARPRSDDDSGKLSA